MPCESRYASIRPFQWACLGLFIVGKVCGILAAIFIVGTAYHPHWRETGAVMLGVYVTLIASCIVLSICDWRRQERC